MNLRNNQRRTKQVEQLSSPGPGAPVDDIKTTEDRLTSLLDDFNCGRVQAFGLNCPYEKLDEVRKKQEELVKLHFEIDQKLQTDPSSRSKRKSKGGLLTDEGRKETQANLQKLSSDLESLGSAQRIVGDHKPPDLQFDVNQLDDTLEVDHREVNENITCITPTPASRCSYPGSLRVSLSQCPGLAVPTTAPSSLLLRLFESSLFSMDLALQYLHTSTDPGVQEYLMKKMFAFPDEDVDFYLPQLITMCFRENDLRSFLNIYIMQRCCQSMEFAMNVSWLLETHSDDDLQPIKMAQLASSTQSFDFFPTDGNNNSPKEVLGSLIESDSLTPKHSRQKYLDDSKTNTLKEEEEPENSLEVENPPKINNVLYIQKINDQS